MVLKPQFSGIGLGGKRPGAAKSISKKVAKMKKNTRVPVRIQGPPDKIGVGFPGRYLPDDQKRDTEFEFKKRYLEPGDHPFFDQIGDAVQLVDHLTEEDKKYMKDKERAMENLNIMRYRLSFYNLNDPKQAWLAQQSGVLTDYYKAQETAIKYQKDIEERLALIRQKGVAGMDEDDWEFVYKIDQGIIQYFPNGQALYNPGAYDNFPYAPGMDSRKRGLFNPKLGTDRSFYGGPMKNDPIQRLNLTGSATAPDVPILQYIFNVPTYRAGTPLVKQLGPQPRGAPPQFVNRP